MILMDRIILLTGERGVGKTHVCERVVEEARSRGFSCAGVLSRALFEGQDKVGINLVDVASGEERPLASADDVPGEVRWGRYRFVASSVAWGTEALAKASPCDLLVVDEVGPLELERGQGFAMALDVLAKGSFALGLVVIRPALLDRVAGRLQGKRPLVLEVSLGNRDLLPGRIIALLEEEAESARE